MVYNRGQDEFPTEVKLPRLIQIEKSSSIVDYMTRCFLGKVPWGSGKHGLLGLKVGDNFADVHITVTFLAIENE
jgi:hypothetical protein